MKALIQFAFLILFLNATSIAAQYGYGNRYGSQRGRSSIPQAQAAPKEPEAKTADQLVDEILPSITESVGLDPFEEAVVRTSLVKFVQKRMELQILELDPEKTREELEKISKIHDEELKHGLPEDKYEAYKKLQENRFKTKKKKKKKKKSKS